MDKIIKPVRLAIIIVLLAAMSAVVLTSLYRVQIIEGEEYLEQSKNSIVTTTTVAAARGNILDRYGRVLVSNRTCNNLLINTNELFEQEDPNAIILELAQTVLDSGDKYNDTLPVTKQAPFTYSRNITDIQQTLLDAYLERNELPASTTAVELMASFRENYDIDNNYTSEEMRIIAGIRYELNIRNIINTSDYIFAEDVSIDLITRLMENDVPGFQVVNSFVREYSTAAAAHVLGVVGMMDRNEYENIYKEENYPFNALVGKGGIEKAFESILHGVDGEAMVTSTKGGTVISTKYTKEVEPGDNVTVTLDIGLQEAAENALKSYIEKTNSEREANNAKYEGLPAYESQVKDMITGGSVVAVNVKTGEPLCIASYPTFNISTYFEDSVSLDEDPAAPLFNRALNGRYAPGSTFKPVTAIAALEEGVVTVNTTIYDKGVYEDTGDPGYTPTCWIYPQGTHGDVNVTKAVEVSCNYYFYDVGKHLGIDLLSEYALRFGLGTSTGIELAEETGVMSTQEYKNTKIGEPWYIGDTLSAAIGQSYSLFTPLQLAVYTSAIANNGVRYEASILKNVRSYDYSESIFQRSPVVADTVEADREYFDAVKLGMYNVANSVNGSSYSYFGNFPVKVAAKTGTAQLGEGVTNNGVFICYAPYDDPEIAVSVVIEKGSAGSAVASIAKEVLEYYFNFKNSSASIETENSLLR